jgi:uncharacterized protein (DUF362 family)
MSKNFSESRRSFVKKSAVGVTGLMAAGSGINEVFSLPESASGKVLEINPYINNLRVVYIEDPAMLQNGTNTAFETFSVSNTKVNAARVTLNLDKMACALAWEPLNTMGAWETIFQKPANKNWADVQIAFKPNCAAGGTDGQTNPHASIAIINAVCDALIKLGAKSSNMTIYDTSGFSVNPSLLYPAGSMVSGIKFLGPSSRSYPAPLWSTVSRAALEADILINIASCKGHSELGGATLTMKNHLGTVGGHVSGALAVQQILDIHNSEAVLGKPVPGLVPPKQQLAIIDCLWSAQDGPLSAPDKAPCMIVMGTSCPAVDCFTAIKVRLEKLKYSGVRETFISYLTSYGYNADTEVEPLLKTPSPPEDLLKRGWIDVNTWNPGIAIKGTNKFLSKNATFSITGSAFKPITKIISLPPGENIKSISIMDIKGRVVQNLACNGNTINTLTWDARNQKGRIVGAGMYLLKISGTKMEKAVKFTLCK